MEIPPATQTPALPKYVSRGRRPFLVPERAHRFSEKLQGESQYSGASRKMQALQGSQPHEEQSREPLHPAKRWDIRSRLVLSWMRSNPLNLGLDEHSVQFIKEQLRRGKEAAGDAALQEKCWKHICVEFETVPGNPTKAGIDAENTNNAPRKTAAVQAGSSMLQSRLPSIGPASGVYGSSRDISQGPSDNQSSRSEADSTSTFSERSSERSTSNSRKQKKASFPAGKPHKSAKQLRRRFSIPLGKEHVQLSKMTMLERQEYCLSRKKQREASKRRQKEEKEKAECTYDPKRFTRRSGFSKVESIVKKIVQSPSPSPAGRRKTLPESFTSSPSHKSMTATKDHTTRIQLQSLNAQTIILDEPPSDTLYSKPTVIAQSKNVDAPAAGTKQIFIHSTKSQSSSRSRSKSKSAILPSATTNTTSPQLKTNKVHQRRDGHALLPEASQLLAACKHELEQSSMLDKSVTFGNPAEPSPALTSSEVKPSSPTEKCENSASKVALKHRFLPNSTSDRGKMQLQEYSDFQLDSFYRKRDRGSAKPGVSLMMGRREDDFSEQVVHVVFDRSKFSEEQASEWMERNAHRFKTGPGQGQDGC